MPQGFLEQFPLLSGFRGDAFEKFEGECPANSFRGDMNLDLSVELSEEIGDGASKHPSP